MQRHKQDKSDSIEIQNSDQAHKAKHKYSKADTR